MHSEFSMHFSISNIDWFSLKKRYKLLSSSAFSECKYIFKEKNDFLISY